MVTAIFHGVFYRQTHACHQLQAISIIERFSALGPKCNEIITRGQNSKHAAAKEDKEKSYRHISIVTITVD